MDLADALPLGELAAAFASLPMFPLFDTAYFIISVLYLKYEPGECGPWPWGGLRYRCALTDPAQTQQVPPPAGPAPAACPGPVTAPHGDGRRAGQTARSRGCDFEK